MIDFVGQLSPVSKWRLCTSDILCFAFQILLMSATLEKQGLLGDLALAPEETQTRQTHDAEEAGRLNADPGHEEDAEMHSLPRIPSVPRGAIADNVREVTLDEGPPYAHVPQDTGEQFIANFDVLGLVQNQWRLREN